MSMFHLLGRKVRPPKLKSVPFFENLPKFHLDLCSPRYSNSPQVSCLGMNSGRGWNPNLEGSYILGYNESKAEFWKQCKSRFYIHPMKFSAPKPSPSP